MEREAGGTAANVVHIEIADTRLTGPVLERLVSGAAVHADLPLDRMFDALSVVDAMVEAAKASLDGQPHRFALSIEPGCLRLSFTALGGDEADRLVDASSMPDVGNVIERLSGGVSTHSDESGTVLTVQLT